MTSLDRNLRRDLENAVKKARRIAETGARQVLEQLAVNQAEPWSALTPDQCKLRNRLRAHGRQLGDRLDKDTVKLNDQPVTAGLIGVHRPIDPGKHTVGAFVTGRSPVTQEISLGDAEKKEVELTVETPQALPDMSEQTPDKPPPPPPAKGMSPLRLAGIAGMGVGAAGLIVGGVFLGLRASKQGDANAKFDTCKERAGGCNAAEKSEIGELDADVATFGTAGVVSLVAGGVLGGAGVALFLLGGPKKPQPAAGYVLPFVTPNGGGIFGTF